VPVTDYRSPTSDFATGGTIGYSSGTTGYNLVNDYPDTADPLTSYVQLGTTANSFIAFNFSAFTVPTGSTGISVGVDYYDEEASSGANTSVGRLRVGGTYYDSATHNPATTTTQRTKTWATNPRTAANWTVAEVNGTDGTNPLQNFGVIGPDSNPAWRLGAIRISVTYTAPDQTFTPSEATGTGQAYDPTIAASGSASFSPGEATGTGQAYTPDIVASGDAPFSPDVATGTGQAYDATIENEAGDQTLAPDTATGTGQAYDPTISGSGDVSFSPGEATGTGQAYDPGITASGDAGFSPESASGTGQAYDASISASGDVEFAPDGASGTGQAYDVSFVMVIGGSGPAWYAKTISARQPTSRSRW